MLILGAIEWVVVFAIPYGLDWLCMKAVNSFPDDI